jgi:membrane-associated phospholipid phosphatase
MNRAAGRSTEHRATQVEAEALTRTSLQLVLAYLAATSIPIIRLGTSGEGWLAAALHSAALLVVLLALRSSTPMALRAWMPLALGPYLYIELRWIIQGTGFSHRDGLVARWDAALGSRSPWHLTASPADSPIASELLHLAYLSYYALVYVPPALLWMRSERAAFAETVLALMIVYGMCFVVFILFPVDGPRFLHGPAGAPDGAIRSIVIQVLEGGSSRGTAFPSAHVAASLVASVYALRFHRIVGIVAGTCTLGMAVGAVYGGYHYSVDIVAGVLAGALALLAAHRVTDIVLSRTHI